MSAFTRVRDRRGANAALRPGQELPQIQFLEKIIALVVDDNECREILDLNLPDRFHAELGIFLHRDLLDAVLGDAGGRAADGDRC